MKYTNEQINTIYRSLPLDVREVIASVEYMDKVQAIGKKYKLMIDKTGTLSEETGFVLMGLTPSKDFAKNIRERLEVSEDVAVNIVKEINEQIFFAVRESLKKIFEKREEGEGSSLLAGSFLGKKEKGWGSLLSKTEEKTDEETLKREDILREIEDKEHHNLPSTNKTERHLEIPFPSEIVNLEAKLPSEIAPSGQAVFQNQKTADDIKKEKPLEINFQPEQIQKKPPILQEEALRTMPKDIIKAKMGGTVSVPKETVEIEDAVSPPKAKLPDVGKIDPYREQISL